MAKQKLYPRPGHPCFYWPSINWRLILAIVVTSVLYPVHVAIGLRRKVAGVGLAIETTYWQIDRSIDLAGQVGAIALVCVAAVLISPIKVMA